MIADMEKIAIGHGKHFIRLDCTVDNAFLNGYYASMEYVEAGRCEDGNWLGEISRIHNASQILCFFCEIWSSFTFRYRDYNDKERSGNQITGFYS